MKKKREKQEAVCWQVGKINQEGGLRIALYIIKKIGGGVKKY